MTLPSSPSPDPTCQTPQRVHWACYGLLAIVFVYVLIDRYARPLVLQPAVNIRTAEVVFRPATRPVETRIDPNTATWAELARLPRVGEKMAKNIVAYRQQNRPLPLSDGTVPPVFRSVDDLRGIKGIGPKTINLIAPLLKLPDDPWADDALPMENPDARYPHHAGGSPYALPPTSNFPEGDAPVENLSSAGDSSAISEQVPSPIEQGPTTPEMLRNQQPGFPDEPESRFPDGD